MAQILHKEGACRWSLHSFFDDCQEKKEHTHTGFTNDNKTITKTMTFWHQKWSVWDTAFFVLFPFSCLFLCSSFSFSFPFSCPFSFPFFLSFFVSFSIPFPFGFLSFSYLFPFPFLFLSLSIPILSFPFLCYSFSFSLSSLMCILWSRCEASAWKNDKRKKKR